MRSFAADMKTGGITPRQLAVLLTVEQSEGPGLPSARGSTARRWPMQCAASRKRGVVERRRTRHDVRAYAVTLTGEGRNLLGRAAPLARRVDRRVLDALPVNRREVFTAALISIVSAPERFDARSGRESLNSLPSKLAPRRAKFVAWPSAWAPRLPWR
jgi:hypothetical protein